MRTRFASYQRRRRLLLTAAVIIEQHAIHLEDLPQSDSQKNLWKSILFGINYNLASTANKQL